MGGPEELGFLLRVAGEAEIRFPLLELGLVPGDGLWMEWQSWHDRPRGIVEAAGPVRPLAALMAGQAHGGLLFLGQSLDRDHRALAAAGVDVGLARTVAGLAGVRRAHLEAFLPVDGLPVSGHGVFVALGALIDARVRAFLRGGRLFGPGHQRESHDGHEGRQEGREAGGRVLWNAGMGNLLSDGPIITAPGAGDVPGGHRAPPPKSPSAGPLDGHIL